MKGEGHGWRVAEVEGFLCVIVASDRDENQSQSWISSLLPISRTIGGQGLVLPWPVPESPCARLTMNGRAERRRRRDTMVKI